jgi:hypothetical protein
MASFGIITALVTASMKRQLQRQSQPAKRIDVDPRQQQQQQQQKAFNTTHVYHPPSRLVQYLHDHCGKKWEHYTKELEDFVRDCPKVELHVHLDGSLDPDFLWHCLQKYDNDNNGDDDTEGNSWIGCLPVSTTLPWDPNHPVPVQ